MITTLIRHQSKPSRPLGGNPGREPAPERLFTRLAFRGRDPAAADVNLYRYCRGNAAIRTDPLGLVSIGPEPVLPKLEPWERRLCPPDYEEYDRTENEGIRIWRDDISELAPHSWSRLAAPRLSDRKVAPTGASTIRTTKGRTNA